MNSAECVMQEGPKEVKNTENDILKEADGPHIERKLKKGVATKITYHVMFVAKKLRIKMCM